MTLASQMSGNQGQDKDTRFYGVVVGVVTNIDDPDKTGRVKVSFPWLSSDDESYWARVTQIMTGNDRGGWFIPEVGDEVLVAFEHGDIRHPYVIGSLFNGKDKPPSESNFSSDNNIRLIKSRSGHIIKLDDTSGSEQIVIVSKNSKSTITLKADGNIEIKSDNIKIEATQTLDLKGQNVNVKADMKLSCTGGSGFEVKSNANGDINASGILNVKGSMLNLN